MTVISKCTYIFTYSSEVVKLKLIIKEDFWNNIKAF